MRGVAKRSVLVDFIYSKGGAPTGFDVDIVGFDLYDLAGTDHVALSETTSESGRDLVISTWLKTSFALY